MISDADWIELVKQVTRLEETVRNIETNHMVHIKEELEWIKKRLNNGYRPPWSVVCLITFLASLSIGLLVAFVKQVGG